LLHIREQIRVTARWVIRDRKNVMSMLREHQSVTAWHRDQFQRFDELEFRKHRL